MFGQIRMFFEKEHPASRFSIINLRNKFKLMEDRMDGIALPQLDVKELKELKKTMNDVMVEFKNYKDIIIQECVTALEEKGILIASDILKKTRTAASSETDKYTVKAKQKPIEKTSDAKIEPKKLQIKPNVTGQKLKNLLRNSKKMEDEMQKEEAQ